LNADVNGRILVFTGDGKGKTTAALGLAFRAAGHGLRACVIQFIKARKDTGEMKAAERLGGNLEIIPMGAGFVTTPGGTESDRARAREALERAWEKMRDCDLLVLDEIHCAIEAGLVGLADVLDLLEHRPPGLHVVLTGRNAPQELVDLADTATNMTNLRHAGEHGTPAVRGIEF